MKELLARIGYLEKIEPFFNKSLVKVLSGQRRVGKSFLMRQIADKIKTTEPKANIIYINLEDYGFDSIKKYHDLINYTQSKLKESHNYLFIDEIQEVEGFEKAIRHFLLNPNIDIYCTGSNAKLLSGELSTFLSGRYVEFTILGLTYAEFLLFHSLENNQEALMKYLKWGTLPFLKNLETNDEVIYEYLKNIFSSLIYKDVVQRFQIRNSRFLEDLVFFLAQHTGSLVTPKKISDFLKSQNINLTPQVCINYLEHLKQAFLIDNVKRMDLQGKKVFEINEKYYFTDWGLANAILGLQRFDVSKCLENVVYHHLKTQGFQIFVGKMNDKEIDFVAEKNGTKMYVQVAYLIASEEVKEREFGNLLSIKDAYPKYVVSLDTFAPKNIEGVQHIHLKDFLLTDL
jgi:uncharacterized protein